MPSELARLIASTREARGLGLGALEVAIHRLVKRLPADRKLRLLRQLERTVK